MTKIDIKRKYYEMGVQWNREICKIQVIYKCTSQSTSPIQENQGWRYTDNTKDTTCSSLRTSQWCYQVKAEAVRQTPGQCRHTQGSSTAVKTKERPTSPECRADKLLQGYWLRVMGKNYTGKLVPQNGCSWIFKSRWVTVFTSIQQYVSLILNCQHHDNWKGSTFSLI